MNMNQLLTALAVTTLYLNKMCVFYTYEGYQEDLTVNAR
jgi:hypothetical protein